MKRRYQIPNKPTWYNGILFRACLEARWAVFFDCLGISYRYEPHSFDVATGVRCVKYKPDFFLPSLSKYIEIKPSKPVEIENIRCAAWTRDIGNIYLLFHLNEPSDKTENGWLYYHDETMKGPPLICDKQYWCECPNCGKIDIEQCGEIESCGCFNSEYYNQKCEYDDYLISSNLIHSERLMKAYRIAKNRKFDGKGKGKAGKIILQQQLF